MTTYEFYRKTARILTSSNEDALFDYIIHSMDDNGSFLRSRYCYWTETLPDMKCGDIQVALFALRSPFDFENSKEYYKYEDGSQTFTRLKMQLFFFDLSDEKRFMEEAEWSAAAGFSYPIKIDLRDMSYEILPRVRE